MELYIISDLKPYYERKRLNAKGWACCILTCVFLLAAFIAMQFIEWRSRPRDFLDDDRNNDEVSDHTREIKAHNIVLIVLDDAGLNDISFSFNVYEGMKWNPYASFPTPHIDDVFSSGVYFSNYQTSIVCTPSRGSMMTGRFIMNIGLQVGVVLRTCLEGAIPRNTPTFA